MEKYYEIGKVQWRHNVWQPILLSACFLLLSPLIVGIRNLNMEQSAKVLETCVAMTGIILFPPVFYPEQNRELRDLIQVRYTRISDIYLLRTACCAAAGALLLFLYMKWMQTGDCDMQMNRFFFGTFAEILMFGGMGLFAYALSDNLIVGYMIPLVYYMAGIGAGAKYLKWFYPFGMITDFRTKYFLLAGGILLGAAGVWLRCRKGQ